MVCPQSNCPDEEGHNLFTSFVFSNLLLHIIPDLAQLLASRNRCCGRILFCSTGTVASQGIYLLKANKHVCNGAVTTNGR